jgi:hypothetical protein
MALARWQRTIQTNTGIIVPGASVEVRRESDNGLASLFSDRAGTAGIGNPFAADSEGFAAFHVVGGAYKITVTGGGLSRVWRYQGVGTTQEFDTDQLIITAANLPDMTEGTTLGRALGSGTGDPVALTALQQFLNVVASGGSLFGPSRSLALSSTPVTLSAADSGKVITNFNATRTVNLPAFSGNAGVSYAFWHGGTGSLTVTTNGADQITWPDTSGTTTINITAGQSFVIATDGGVWVAIASNVNPKIASLTAAGAISIGSAAQYRANTAGSLAMNPNELWASAAAFGLTDAATIAVDMNAGYNFSVTLGGNRTLGNPTNTKNGQCGAMLISQDGTGSRTLGYGANYDFAGGTPFVLSTGINARDLLTYYTISSTSILFTGINKAIA